MFISPMYFEFDSVALGGLPSMEGRLQLLIAAALIWLDTVVELLSSASLAPDTFEHSV